MNDDLLKVFKQSSSVSIIEGPRDSGKTDTGFRIAEELYIDEHINILAANVLVLKPLSWISHITYYDDLKDWLQRKGVKIIILDELGDHLYRMSFSSKKTKMILRICQLVRKWDAHFIGMAPSAELIVKWFKNREILDLILKKPSKTSKGILNVNNKVTRRAYRIKNWPRTNISFLTKDIAPFELVNPERTKKKLNTMTAPARASLLYTKFRSLRKVGRIMDISHEEVRKLLDKHIQNQNLDLSTVNTAEVV